MFENLLANLAALRPFAWRAAMAFTLVTSFLLFSPERWLVNIGLWSFVNTSRTSITILLLLSTSIISVEVFDVVLKNLKNRFEKFTYKQNLTKHLSTLSGDEKVLLRRFVDDDVSTINCSYSDGTANFLQGKGILTRSSSLGQPGFGANFPYSIQPVALRILREKPNLLS